MGRKILGIVSWNESRSMESGLTIKDVKVENYHDYYLAAGGGGTYAPTESLRNLLGAEGATDVKAELLYGWSNMPEVFTFRATEEIADAIEVRILEDDPPKFLPLVLGKDW